MSQDSFSEITSQSWFSRIAGAIKGVLLGIVLFLISFPLLWWNEGRAVHTAKDLEEAGGRVVSLSADMVDPADDTKLVHMTAKATTDETLSDPEFSISLPAIKLQRKVEMYQWMEKESSETVKKVGGGSETKKTWSYEKGWSDKLIDSSKFKNKPEEHANPAAMRYSTTNQNCKTVHFGAFTLSPGLVSQLTGYETIPLDAKNLDNLPVDCKKQSTVSSNAVYMPDDANKASSDPKQPEIGDLRITFQAVQPATVSIMARQVGSTFEPWTASSGGTRLEVLVAGTVDAAGMVAEKQAQNNNLTWILRGVGFVLMAFGIGLVFGPLAVMADVLPFLGDLLRGGVALFAGLVAAALSLVTIAAAWMAYRPVLGVGLLIVGAGLIVGLKMLCGKKRGPVTAAAPGGN